MARIQGLGVWLWAKAEALRCWVSLLTDLRSGILRPALPGPRGTPRPDRLVSSGVAITKSATARCGVAGFMMPPARLTIPDMALNSQVEIISSLHRTTSGQTPALRELSLTRPAWASSAIILSVEPVTTA